MTPAAQFWQDAYEARARPEPSRNALACRRRQEERKTAGLCVFCGERPAASLCDECKKVQSGQRKARDQQRRAELAGTSFEPRKYTRRKGRQ